MKKLWSISLALVLLISNIGLTMGTHYCGGLAVKNQLMIGQNHLNCGMSGMGIDIENKTEEGKRFKAKPCCENHYQIIKTDKDYNSGRIPLSFKSGFVTVIAYSYLNLTFFAEIETPQYIFHSPPLLLRDIYILNQAFLI